MVKGKPQGKNFQKIIVIASLIIYFGLCFFLFYMQLNASELGIEGKYRSDLPSHVTAAASANIAGYSLLYYIFDLFYQLSFASSILTAAFIAFFAVATLPALWKLFQTLQPEGKSGVHWLLAWAANFMMAIYFPGLTNRYLGTFSPSIWHNSTYIVMRFFAIVALVCYFILNKTYKDKINWKIWFVFAVSLALSMAIKPSFVFCFAPIMAIYLLRDWIKNSWKGFKNIFLFGLAVIPSVIIGVLQLTILSTAEYGAYFSFMRVLHVFTAHPYISMFTSVVFPLVALILIGNYLLKFQDVQMVLLAFVFGVVQAMVISETGTGANDGNYLWGALVMNYFLFAVIALRCYGWCKEKLIGVAKRKTSDMVAAGLMLVAFGLHLYNGVYYFVLLLQGGSFI